MKPIELKKWELIPSKPRRLKYAGQPTAQEVFEELRYRLESMGYLPDEYFILDNEWEKGRKIPKGADIFCVTDYGASEGIYIDVYLKWHDDGKPVTKSFITGKTLGESGSDLDRMFLIASAITKRCSSEEILASPSELLEVPMVCGNMGIPKVLAVKGINGDHALRPFIKCRGQGEPWMVKELLDMGMKVSPDNYDALAACVEYNCPEIGKALIDHGIDYGAFEQWAMRQEHGLEVNETSKELEAYWQDHQLEPEQEQSM